jgi:hypothetical protein
MIMFMIRNLQQLGCDNLQSGLRHMLKCAYLEKKKEHRMVGTYRISHTVKPTATEI